jgi:23S rRNA G2445 N2-methylase RlmL
MSSRSQPVFVAHTQPGFEVIAAAEIRSLEGAAVHELRVLPEKNGLVLFSFQGDAALLLELRTVEDVFAVVLSARDMAPTFAGLKAFEEQVRRASTFEPALQLVRQLRPGRGGRGQLRFRVVARQAGQTYFRRVDAQVGVEKAIAQRGDHRWQREEEGALEFWLTLWQPRGRPAGDALLALRLSDERMRHRSYKVEHLPASLRPSSAAAMVWLTDPRDDDVFLDPMCGAGTILIERALAGRYQLLLGGDASREALAVAQANVGPRYKPIELHDWDARDLPIDAGSVTAAAVNLPFGRQVGTPEENRTLYPAVLRELARVLRPGARLALLSGDARLLAESLRRAPALRERNGYAVQVLGRPARLVLVERG